MSNQYEAFLRQHGYRLYAPHRAYCDGSRARRERRVVHRALRNAARVVSLTGWGLKWR